MSNAPIPSTPSAILPPRSPSTPSTPSTPSSTSSTSSATAPPTTDSSARVPYPSPRSGCPFAPAPAYEAARDLPPSQVELYDGRLAWLITRHADARIVLSDSRFSADGRTPGFPLINERMKYLLKGEPSFIRMDAPEHTRLRKHVTSWFTNRRVQQLRPRIQEIVDERIDLIEARGAAELIADFALPIPSLVICEILGVPYEDHDFFEQASQAILRWNVSQAETEKSWAALQDYLVALTDLKRKEPDDRIVSHLGARDDLTTAQVASISRTLLVAGHDTTAATIGLAVAALLREPEKLDRLKADPELYPEAAEELLRYLAPVGGVGLGRAAVEDVDVNGTVIRAGEGALVVLPAANRDAAVWPDAAELLLEGERESGGSHMTFGHGPHLCLGAPLARLEFVIALETLFRRLPGLRLAVPFEELGFRGDASVYGLQELPVRW
ncbi:cytochrome P450 [Streptomyces sp. NPDC048290]|uniref:cytochrome P450 n=1 Tax=Streptomyces sp. NPDC048290 TaxID=3155811 RepID=UPI003448A3CF